MEPQIIDYYNEYPYGINVIDKMNQELEESQNKIKELEEYQNKCKEYENSKGYIAQNIFKILEGPITRR